MPAIMPSSRPSWLQGSRRSRRPANASSAADEQEERGLPEHRHQQGEDDLRQQRDVPIGERQGLQFARGEAAVQHEGAPEQIKRHRRDQHGRDCGKRAARGDGRIRACQHQHGNADRYQKADPRLLGVDQGRQHQCQRSERPRPGDAAREIPKELCRQPDGEQRGHRKRRLAVRRDEEARHEARVERSHQQQPDGTGPPGRRALGRAGKRASEQQGRGAEQGGVEQAHGAIGEAAGRE